MKTMITCLCILMGTVTAAKADLYTFQGTHAARAAFESMAASVVVEDFSGSHWPRYEWTNGPVESAGLTWSGHFYTLRGPSDFAFGDYSIRGDLLAIDAGETIYGIGWNFAGDRVTDYSVSLDGSHAVTFDYQPRAFEFMGVIDTDGFTVAELHGDGYMIGGDPFTFVAAVPEPRSWVTAALMAVLFGLGQLLIWKE